MSHTNSLSTTDANQENSTKNFVAWFVKSLALAIISACLTGLAFYYNTNNVLSSHTEKLSDHAMILKEHGDAIIKISQNMGMTEAQASYFEKRLNAIEESQKEILSEIREIKRGQ